MNEPTLAALYGPEVSRAVGAVNVIRAAAAKADPLGDPGGTVGYAVDAARQLAGVLGVEVDAGGLTGVAPIMGAVIKGYVNLLTEAMARKGQQEDKARAAAQVAVLTAAVKNANGDGAWEMVAEQDDVGQAAYFTNYKNIGLPGVLSKRREAVFPVDPGKGCYRVNPRGDGGRLPESERPWRIWPGLFPFCFNTPFLGVDASAANLHREAAQIITNLLAVCFDPLWNLQTDARLVAASFKHFWSWSAPMRDGLKGGGLVFTGPPLKHLDSDKPTAQRGDLAAALPFTRSPNAISLARHAAGERNIHYGEDGLTLFAMPAPGPVGRTWYDFSDGWARPIGSCTLDAYNIVVTRFARFFAVRELAMRTRGGWDATWRQGAAESDDPDVRAALKRRPPPMPRETTTTRGPGAPPVKVRKPVRVGRAGPQRVGRVELSSVFEAATMQEFADRLATWSRRR